MQQPTKIGASIILILQMSPQWCFSRHLLDYLHQLAEVDTSSDRKSIVLIGQLNGQLVVLSAPLAACPMVWFATFSKLLNVLG